MSRHLITGGAGFIGSALAHRLVRDGHEVTVLDRFSRGKQDRLPAGAKVIVGDIRSSHLVYDAVNQADAEVIWHLAYVQGTQTFYADPKDVIDVALRGIMNVLGACELRTTKPDLILVSSSEVYQEPPAGMFPTDESVPLSVPDVTNPRYSYGGGKIASEIAALAYSQAGVLNRAVIVRPHNIYGPDMGFEHVIPEFAERMRDLVASQETATIIPVGKEIVAADDAGMDVGEYIRSRALPFKIQGSGRETRSFCHISDCVDGLVIAGERGADRNVYHLGNPGEEYTIEDVAHLVASQFGREIDVIPGALPKGSPTRRLPDISKLQALGYRPKVPLAKGIEETVVWYALNQQVAA